MQIINGNLCNAVEQTPPKKNALETLPLDIVTETSPLNQCIILYVI